MTMMMNGFSQKKTNKMAHVLNSEINPNHPCADKNCNECETCIFDQNLFLENHKNKKAFHCPI